MKNQDVERNETEIVTKSGVRDSRGNIIVPIEYDFVTKVNDNLFVATKGSINGCRRTVGKETYQKENGLPYGESFSCHLENKTLDTEVEFYTKRGKMYSGSKIIAAVPCFNKDMLLLLHEDYKWSMAVIDYRDQIILGGVYVDADSIEIDYYNNRFIVAFGSKFIIVSFNGESKVVNTTILLDGEPVKLYDKGAIVKKNGKYGFINYTGKVILTAMYDEVIPQKDIIRTVTNGGVELFTYEGKFLVGGENYNLCISLRWKGIEFFILGHKDGTYCLWTSNKQLLDCEYTSIEMCEEFAKVCKDEKYALLRYDKESNEMVAVFPKNFSDEGYDKMRFEYTKAATYVIAEKRAFPINDVYRYNLKAFEA